MISLVILILTLSRYGGEVAKTVEDSQEGGDHVGGGGIVRISVKSYSL